jgi:hypothetical protein
MRKSQNDGQLDGIERILGLKVERRKFREGEYT